MIQLEETFSTHYAIPIECKIFIGGYNKTGAQTIMTSFNFKNLSKRLSNAIDAAAAETTKKNKPRVVLGAEQTVELDPSLPKPASMLECASFLLYQSPYPSALNRYHNLLFLSHYRYLLEQTQEQKETGIPRPLIPLFITPLEFCRDGIRYPLLDLRKFDIYASSTQREYALTDFQKSVLEKAYLVFSRFDDLTLANLITGSSIYQNHKSPPTSPQETLHYFDSLRKISPPSPQGPN